MKENLKKIFQDVSSGKLTQKEALEKIKVIKQQEQGNTTTGTLLCNQVWEVTSLAVASENTSEYVQQHIILCEMPQIKEEEVKASFPDSEVLVLQVDPQQNIANRYSSYALICFDYLRTLLTNKVQGKILVQIVTGNSTEQAVFTGLSGLLKTAGLENPKLVGQVIITHPEVEANTLFLQLEESQTMFLDPVIKYEQDIRYVLRNKEIPATHSDPKIAFKDHGVYLITGGMGGLGLLFAKEILKQTTHSRIILTGRSILTSEKKAVLDALPVRNSSVEYHPLDVNNLDQVSTLISSIVDGGKQINGILHCAGMTSDNFIIKKTNDEFGKVLTPKVSGTFNLDLASKDLDLDFMVLFSSVASLLGNVGQADYAVANGFMDWFSVYRNGLVSSGDRQGHTVSINWPLWQEGGMQIDQKNQEILKQTMDVQPMETILGMYSFYRSLEFPHNQVLVMKGNDLSDLGNTKNIDHEVKKEPLSNDVAIDSQIVSDNMDLFKKTEDYLCKEFSSLLKLTSRKMDPQEPLEKYGIDSILAMKFTSQLEKTFGSLSKTLFFEYQNIRELTEYFVTSHPAQLAVLFNTKPDNINNKKSKDKDIQPQISNQTWQEMISGKRFINSRPFADLTNSKPSPNTDPIAIVGLSGRYPESVNIEAYWDNLRAGKDCITEVPKERWDWREYYSEDRTKSGRHYSKWGGFIEGVDEFDPRFFNISPREAKSIDPQERLFLQHSWMAVEDAGYTRASLQIPHGDMAGQVGVYAGVMYGEYNLSGSLASIANRVSYFLNLHGPSMTLDTMCSSSLTAIHLACQDLKEGRTDLGIAGGVNVSVHPNKYLMLSSGQFISSAGHCQSFGEGGDGYIPGEGVGVVVLKRLSEAKRDGNHIYGVIKGSSLNHGGKTNGYSVPNPKAQASAITHALQESGTDPRHISYIEAHGTGTKLGDPIEIAALSKAFHKEGQDTGYCLLGSAKSNIGHCESAAGIAGVTKILLQMQHRQIVPSLHSTRLNPHIDFEKTPFIVNQSLTDWDRPVVAGKTLSRIAGISSFGAGGSNAHIIIEEYVETTSVPSDTESGDSVAILLSARTGEQLEQKAHDLLRFLKRSKEEEHSLDLLAMGYTLQVGREAMDVRLGLLTDSVVDLSEKLEAYLGGEKNNKAFYEGQVKDKESVLSRLGSDTERKQTVNDGLSDKNTSKLLELWVAGQDLDWKELYKGQYPKFISLPGYPFAKERYWIAVSEKTNTVSNAGSGSVLHPLLHKNASDFEEQRYSSTFTGAEFFISDYELGLDPDSKPKVLPVVAYLEMAHAAIREALASQEEPYILELQDIVWADPVQITENSSVHIALLAQTKQEFAFEVYSTDADKELVHCQGYVTVKASSLKRVLDLTDLKRQTSIAEFSSATIYSFFTRMGRSYGASYQGIMTIHLGDRQLLAELEVPEVVVSSLQDYVLHPGIVESGFQAGIVLLGGDIHQASVRSMILDGLDSVQVLGACTQKMFAWVRYSADTDLDTKLDIDLCDSKGHICVELRGVYYKEETFSPVEQESYAKVASPKQLEAEEKEEPKESPKEIYIPLTNSNKADTFHTGEKGEKEVFTEIPLQKPSGILLVSPEELQAAEGQQEVPVLKLQVGLSSTKANTLGETHIPVGISYVRLLDHGNGVYSIHIDSRTNENTLSKEVINQLVEALEFVQQISSLKVLLLKGVDSVFLQGDREAYNEAVLQNLYVAIASFPYPLVSVMQGDATGAGFLIGALSDFMICSKESTYGYIDLNAGMFASVEEEALFKERFGEALTLDLLYQSRVLQGKEMEQKGWSFPVLASEQVEEYAEQLAVSLSKKSQTALRLLKQHLGRHILKYTKKLKTVAIVKEQSSSTPNKPKITCSSKYLQLENTAPHVLTIQISTGKKPYILTDLISGFTDIFSQVAKSKYYKAIVLTSDGSEFISVSDRDTSVEEILKLQDLIYGSTVPVIAAIRSNAKDISLWIAQSCDGCIYQTEGKYSASKLLERPELAKRAAMVFADRLSPYVCKELLLRGKTYTGADLQQQLGAVTVAAKAEVLAKAKELAQQWSKLPLARVTSWKKEHALLIREKIEQLPVWSETKAPTEVSFPKTPTAIALHTQVLRATLYPDGILEVKMEDRDAKNMFSTAFLEGIIEVFQHIAATATYKVVVLTGYDTYFASGGTKESLLAIQQGKAKFTDTKVFQLAMECKIPVIAAMQGHGIGAGWSLGMFSDFILFSEQSHYVSPYMNYGFTPGAAATLVFPDKTGYDLARETLLTAVEYSGRELQEKGLYYPVLPREELLSKAFDIAKEIAKHSRDSLIAIKEQLTKHLRDQLEDTYRLELEMHEKTFVGKTETLQQIERNFYNAATNTQTNTIPEQNIQDYQTQGVVESRDIFLPDIISNLKKLLAQELHLEEEEIDPDSQFVDLGLDSIVGVTFIRKISDAYTIPLQATIVYSYSTLAKLSAHVKEEAEKLGVLVSEPVYQDPIDTRSTISQISQSRDIFLPDIISNLKKLLAQELHLEEEEIDPDSQFVDLGLDSIVGVTFIRKISDAYSIPLQATIVYSYSTLAKLSAHVQEEAEKLGTLVGEQSTFEDRQQKVMDRGISRKEIEKKKKLISWRDGSKSLRTVSKSKRGVSSQAIAVIGMAGQFPEAKDVEEFWQNIAGGKNCIREVSKERWDIDEYYSEGEVVSGKTYSKWMGALEEYDLFDPMFFTISPVEAESMDPQQRLFLQSCWHTIENAGYSPGALSGSKCGVYVGCASGDYLQQSQKHQLSAQGFTGAASSILAARISYFLNLQGPCISIDTACSSSLVAIANACDSLVSGSIDSALAGGVYVMPTPSMHIMSSQSGMLSPDGRCYTFDQRANGFVPGEGVGVVMLKRLEDAEKDQDTILGVIQGWGVNQDGKTNGITAPNTESQTLLEQQVYDQFDIDPNNIQLIETHGTGTKLGDPIEVEGLRKSFKKYTEEKAYCALGSVKSNIGHCLTASGAAGFIKVLQAIKHQQLPPTINFEKLNEHIGLEGSPFYVNTELKDWKVDENQFRQAAISSFGFSGTNAHLVLGEYTTKRAIKNSVQGLTQNSELMIPLSAKSEEQLRVKASDLLKFIEKEGDSLDLVEMAYTLQVGREAMDVRLGLMAASIKQLEEKLQAYIKGENYIEDLYHGHVKHSKEGISIISDDDMKETIIEKYIGQKKLSKLLDLWVKGLELDWNKLYGNQKPKRISLPLYPFAKERYWIEATPNKQDKETPGIIDRLHPLVHKNTSDLRQQRYNSTFSGEEFFLKNYEVKEDKIIPAMTCLEMARVAVMLASSSHEESTVIELNNVFWIQPLTVTENKEIEIVLFARDSDNSNEEQIDFEIYTTETDQEITYLQGQAIYRQQQETAKINIELLKEQMKEVVLESKDIYKVLIQIGFTYGSIFQGIKTIYRGHNQLLAELSTTLSEEKDQEQLILYSIMMEGALQAAIILINDLDLLNQPVFPASLDSIHIISACTKDMIVWVRSNKKQSINHSLDIDLVDQEGNICIQIKGLCLQEFNIDTDILENIEKDTTSFDVTYDNITPQSKEESQQLFFKEYWKDKPFDSNNSISENKQIIIFADEEFREKIMTSDDAKQLTKAIYVFQGQKYKEVSDSIYHCRFNNASDIQKLLHSAANKSNESIALMYSWAKDRKETGILALFNLFKAIKEFNQPVDVTLMGHYEPSSVDTCWDHSWIGFERSLKLVLPNVKISLLYTNESVYTPHQLLDAIHNPEIIWYKGERRFILSFESYDLNSVAQEPILKENGSYLITGGIGKLGFKFAHYLAKEYKAKLVLLGRSPNTADIEEKIKQLKHAGAQEVYYESVDISDEKSITSWAKNLPFELSGIIHAAGVEATQVFHEKTTKSIKEVLQSKSTGTILLDEILEEHPLDFVCYFSSSAAILGDFGSCDYAIANRFLMGYTHYREQKSSNKGKSIVINWPFWKDGGMGKGNSEQAEFYLKSSGQEVLETSEGIEIWHDIIKSDQKQTLVIKGKPTRTEQFLRRIYEVEKPDQLESNTQKLPSHISKGWKIQYQDLSLKDCVYSDLIKLVSKSLKIPSEKLDGITNLVDYGFDSISLTAFSKELAEHFLITITPALLYSYPTIEKLSDYFTQDYLKHIEEFYSKLQSDVKDKETTTVTKPVINQTSLRKRFLQTRPNSKLYTTGVVQEPIAVIGMSGRFPKADTVDQLWSLLEKGESGISEVPLSRWDWRDYFKAAGDPDNKINTNKGGFINNVDEFDPLFFEITPKEAEATDPGQRMLLMEAYKAIEDAQIAPSSLRGTSVGVFVGMEESQYDKLISDEQGVGNSGNAMISSRLSYYLDLHGPAIATNTACSSGLVALHQAIMSLRNGECESALVAGISSLILSPEFYVKMSQAGMLSQDGQCYSFAKQANGIGASEAVVVLMLKPLSAAIKAGNPIYGTIKASGINFDGKTNGVTAPSGKSQEELIKKVYTNYNINPQDISHIVAHGTGTKLGDPIEINALNDAFKKLNKEQSRSEQINSCAITSCKSNLGHTMAASGLVSVVSLLKGLQYNKIPATINCEDENDYINWDNSPFYINKTTKKWEKESNTPRMGSISSFGRSGTNAHVVIEEYISPVEVQPSPVTNLSDGSQVIIVLSSKTTEQLQQKTRDLLDFIDTKNQIVDLFSLAYSLQITRETMEVRLGFIVSSVEELASKLKAYLHADRNLEGVYTGEVKHYDTSISIFNADADLQETMDKWIENKKFSKLLELWVKGLKLDWNKLYGEAKPKFISLPKYPFAKDRYWIQKPISKQVEDRDFVKADKNHEILEDLINEIENESIETDQAIHLLKKYSIN